MRPQYSYEPLFGERDNASETSPTNAQNAGEKSAMPRLNIFQRPRPSQKLDAYDLDSLLSDSDGSGNNDTMYLPKTASIQRTTTGDERWAETGSGFLISPTAMSSSPTHHVAAARRAAGFVLTREPNRTSLKLRSTPQPSLASLGFDGRPVQADKHQLYPELRSMDIDTVSVETASNLVTSEKKTSVWNGAKDKVNDSSYDFLLSCSSQQAARLETNESDEWYENEPIPAAPVAVQVTPETELRDTGALSVSDKAKKRAAERARQAALRAARKVQQENQAFQSPPGDGKRNRTLDTEIYSPGRHAIGAGAAAALSSQASSCDQIRDEDKLGDSSHLLPSSALLPETRASLEGNRVDQTAHSAPLIKRKYPELTEIHGRRREDYIATHGRSLAIFWDDFYANDGYKGSFDFVLPKDIKGDARRPACETQVIAQEDNYFEPLITEPIIRFPSRENQGKEKPLATSKSNGNVDYLVDNISDSTTAVSGRRWALAEEAQHRRFHSNGTTSERGPTIHIEKTHEMQTATTKQTRKTVQVDHGEAMKQERRRHDSQGQGETYGSTKPTIQKCLKGSVGRRNRRNQIKKNRRQQRSWLWKHDVQAKI